MVACTPNCKTKQLLVRLEILRCKALQASLQEAKIQQRLKSDVYVCPQSWFIFYVSIMVYELKV